MKDFCVKQMRREYRGVLRICIGLPLYLFVVFAVFEVIFVAKQVDTKAILTLIGAEVFIALLFLGAYFVLSDVNWLLKKTPFGQSLYYLGNPEEVMADIDQAAEAFCEHHGSFILLRDWMILLLPDGWNLEPYRVSGCPIRRGDIQALRLLPDTDPAEPEEKHIQITWSEGTEDFYTYHQEDLDALRTWMQEGGLTVDE